MPLRPSVMGGPHEKTPSVNQEAGPHRALNLPAPWSWTSSLQDCGKQTCVVCQPQTVLFCYSSPNGHTACTGPRRTKSKLGSEVPIHPRGFSKAVGGRSTGVFLALINRNHSRTQPGLTT